MKFKLSSVIKYILFLCLLLRSYTEGTARILSNKGRHRIEDEFVIVLKKENGQRLSQFNKTFDWEEFKENLKQKTSLTVKHVISFGHFKAAMVKGQKEQLEAILEDANIDYIEMNQKLRHCSSDVTNSQLSNGSFCLVENTGTQIWGLSRLNQRETLKLRSKPTYSWVANEDGREVNAYVMDSGIFIEHEEFEGRAVHGFTSSSIAQFEDDNDNHGHGTHVAGKIGGKTLGVAKGVNLIAVKVLNAYGEGTVVDLLQGLQFIYNDHNQKETASGTKIKSVVNLSLGAEGAAPVMEQAIELLIEEGIPMVVASGNEYRDACQFTPSRISEAITVGATTIKDEMSPFSNYGPCVDILAPGSNILSAWTDDPTSVAHASGTSMAAPHVTGVIARYLSHWTNSDSLPTTSQIRKYLLDTATFDKLYMNIGNVGETVLESTPNILLNAHCGLQMYSSASGAFMTQNYILLVLVIVVFVFKY